MYVYVYVVVYVYFYVYVYVYVYVVYVVVVVVVVVVILKGTALMWCQTCNESKHHQTSRNLHDKKRGLKQSLGIGKNRFVA